MGWKEGVGVLAICAFALPAVIKITSKIGLAGDGIAIFAMLSWVVTAFLGKPVDTSLSRQFHDTVEMRRYTTALKGFVEGGEGPKIGS